MQQRRRATLGAVTLDIVESESIREDNIITDHPVEKGENVSDHARNEPTYIDISGVMTEEAANKLQQLKQYRKDRTILTYTGRNIYDNLVIERFGREHGKQNRYGYSFNITLKRIRIATAKREALPNRGKQQPKKKTVPKATAAKVMEVVKDYGGGRVERIGIN